MNSSIGRLNALPGGTVIDMTSKEPNLEKNFEASLKELEQIVEQLEAGNLPLERSLELFEQGVRLSRECQSRLDEAERKVEMLVKTNNGTLKTIPFEEPSE